MSKAILIVDMPENCFDCRLWHIGDEYPEDFCGVDYRNISNLHERPDWCPLIPEPERINIKQTDDVIARIAYEGWNSCLDELEGR